MKDGYGRTAKQIAEAMMERTGNALIANDFETFADCFHMPHTIETWDRKEVVQTRDHLRRLFDKAVEDYRRKRITQMIRHCDFAEFKGSDRIQMTCTSHLMAGDSRIDDPVQMFSVLAHIDARWLCISSQYAADKNSTVARALETATKGK